MPARTRCRWPPIALLLVATSAWADSVTITQSCDTTTITPLNSIACVSTSGPFYTRQNSYLRRFRLGTSHGIFSSFSVTNVRIGVEDADDGLGTAGQTITVNLYSIATGAPFLYANMALIGTQNFSQANASQVFVDVPITGFIADGQTSDLVVEVVAPDGATDEAFFFIGTNKGGQSAPSYNASPDVGCFGAEPADYAEDGFPDVHIIMEVTGDSASGPAANSSCTPQESKKAPEAICGKIFFGAQAKAERIQLKATQVFVLDGCNETAAIEVGGELDDKIDPLVDKANDGINKVGGIAECDPALQLTLPVNRTHLLDGAESGADFLFGEPSIACDGDTFD